MIQIIDSMVSISHWGMFRRPYAIPVMAGYEIDPSQDVASELLRPDGVIFLRKKASK